MWHASVSYHGRVAVPFRTRVARARRVLAGVGDAELGEWIEEGNKGVIHVRRRLASAEQLRVSVRDIRRTPEARQRYDALPRQMRAKLPAFIVDEEVGDVA